MKESVVGEGRGRWAPAIAAAVVFGAVILASTLGGRGGSSADSTQPSAPIGTDTTVVVSSVPAAPVIETAPSTAPIVKVPLTQTLSQGMAGDSVRMVQQRLKDLGFEPGPIDGIFGEVTKHAVWAFEKLVMGTPRADATGRVTPQMWDRMQDNLVIQPRRPNATSTHMEIYLPEQVGIVFEDDRPVLIAHISTGDEEEWCEEVTIQPGEWNNPTEEPIVRGECGRSITPGGVFQFYRRHEGTRVGSLGGMYNPVYFNYGIAVHGADNVPLYPASHGCVRIHDVLADIFPTLVENGDQVFVFDGKREPEFYGAQKPVFNWLDPDYSTTTSSSSTTSTTRPTSTTSTTRPPSTTTTTRPPSTTTTTKPPATTTTTTSTTVAP